VGDFDGPTYATGAPGDASRVFVVEKPGRVRLVRDGVVLAQPFLDVSATTSSSDEERGLLSAAFAPDYATSGRFYVYLTAKPAGEIQIWEYARSAANPDVADPASGRLLLAVAHTDAANHNGGQVQFGPDGKLWLGTGDGGGGNDQFGHAQDPGSLLGKLIRLDPAAPAPEVVARGLRNPWRFSFDRATGQLVIGDVGQDAFEEIDVGLAENYGWPCFEGTTRRTSTPASCDSATAAPVLTKAHAGDGFCSITGGYVVRDPGLPTLLGRYVYGDFCASGLRSVDLANPASDAAVGLSVDSLSSFGEDACGRILVASLAGPVYRLLDGAPSACLSSAPGPAAPPADTRACVLSARVTGLRSVRRSRRLTIALRSDEACSAVVGARVRGVASFRGGRVELERGKRAVVRVRLTARGGRALRRALRRHASLRVAVSVRATDAAGNVTRLSRAARVRR
jgi:glucose/sorbosone dehydrogenase